MPDGRDRARRSPAESPDDVLARLGLTGGGATSPTGRAARRRAGGPEAPDRSGADSERTTWLEAAARDRRVPGSDAGDRARRPDPADRGGPAPGRPGAGHENHRAPEPRGDRRAAGRHNGTSPHGADEHHGDRTGVLRPVTRSNGHGPTGYDEDHGDRTGVLRPVNRSNGHGPGRPGPDDGDRATAGRTSAGPRRPAQQRSGEARPGDTGRRPAGQRDAEHADAEGTRAIEAPARHAPAEPHRPASAAAATTAIPRRSAAARPDPPSGPGPAADPTVAVPRTRRAREPVEPPTTALPVDGERNSRREEARRIDETLTRLTAAHAGLDLGDRDEPEPASPRRRPRLVRVLVVACVAALVLAAGTGWAAQRWLASGVRDVVALDPGSGAIVDAAAQQGARNVLVVAAGAGAPARPDTVVVAHVPPGGTGVTVLSIPADLEINRPPCARWDAAAGRYTAETVPAQARTQLASALDLGGPQCATRVVQQLTGLAVTQYVGIDLDALGTAVDAVSGVTVCVPGPVVDATLGPIAPAAGPVDLDGRRARSFVTAADVTGDPPTDGGRVGRQQQVLAAVLDTVLDGAGLLDLPRVRALRGALGPALSTDGASLDEVLELARTMGPAGAEFRSVPSTTDPLGKGAVLSDADAAALFAALRTGRPLPAEPASTGPNLAAVKVDVLNATARTGQAAQTGDVLKGLGFTVGTVGSADQMTSQTVIRFSPDQEAAADVLAASVPSATTVADPGASGVLQLVLGRSFDAVVKAPSAAPTSSTPVAITEPCS